MDERKKILLGSKDILSKDVQDFYVNINLSKNNREILPYKYDNVFDLTKFYNKERNECRNFVIYGAISSYICDCDDLKIYVYDGASQNSNLLATVYSKDIVNSQMPFYNVYEKKKGKYEIFLNLTDFSK